jgi:hypothetical protein
MLELWHKPCVQDTSKPAKVYSKGGTIAKYFCLFPRGKSFVFFLTFSGFCLLFNTFVLS